MQNSILMYLRCLLPVICLGTLALWPASAQQVSGTIKDLDQYMVDNWTVDDGLPTNNILAAARTREGYLWFASYDGLIRFDGVAFTLFNPGNCEAFTHPGVNALYEDKQGNLWIATDESGLIRYKNFAFDRLPIASTLQAVAITAITQDALGRIWLGTKQGLAYLDEDQVRLWDHPRLKNIDITALIADQENNLWIGTARGVSLLNPEQIRQDSRASRFADYFVNTIYEDSYGSLWFGTGEGIIRYARGQWDMLSVSEGFAHPMVQTIVEDGQKNLWIGSYRHGIGRIKNSSFLNYGVADGLPHEIVNTIYPEDTCLWIGTGNGLARYKDQHFTSYNTRQGLPSHTIFQVLEDKTYLWMTNDKGVIKADKSQFTGDSLKTVAYKLYNQSDGMKTSQVTGASSSAPSRQTGRGSPLLLLLREYKPRVAQQ